jgi:hypothetical protein
MSEDSEYTYYFSKIPKITSFHPSIKKKYEEKIDRWGKRKFLEAPNISDQAKIRAVGLLDPEASSQLKSIHSLAKKTDKAITHTAYYGNKYISPYLKATPEAVERYNQDKYINLGGRKTKTIYRKNKNKKTKNNKKNNKKNKKTKKQKY